MDAASKAHLRCVGPGCACLVGMRPTRTAPPCGLACRRRPALPRRCGCGPPCPRPRYAALLHLAPPRCYGALLAPPCPSAGAACSLLALARASRWGQRDGEDGLRFFAWFFTSRARAQLDPHGVDSRRRLRTTRSQPSSPPGSTSPRCRLTTRRLHSLSCERRTILQNYVAEKTASTAVVRALSGFQVCPQSPCNCSTLFQFLAHACFGILTLPALWCLPWACWNFARILNVIYWILCWAV
jgi:hypothetical protein